MPIYNSKDNDILAALEETYRAMIAEAPQRGRQPDEDASAHIGQRNAGGAFAGGPQTGIGAKKDITNNPKADDARAKTQADVAAADRAADAQDRADGVDNDEGKGKSAGIEAAEKEADYKPATTFKTTKLKPRKQR